MLLSGNEFLILFLERFHAIKLAFHRSTNWNLLFEVWFDSGNLASIWPIIYLLLNPDWTQILLCYCFTLTFVCFFCFFCCKDKSSGRFELFTHPGFFRVEIVRAYVRWHRTDRCSLCLVASLFIKATYSMWCLSWCSFIWKLISILPLAFAFWQLRRVLFARFTLFLIQIFKRLMQIDMRVVHWLDGFLLWVSASLLYFLVAHLNGHLMELLSCVIFLCKVRFLVFLTHN